MIKGGGRAQVVEGQLAWGSEYAGQRTKPSTGIRSHGAGRADGSARGRRGAVAATPSGGHGRILPVGTMSPRVGFCSLWDPLDPNQWSGYAFSMRQALLEQSCELVDIAPVDPGPRPIDWARKHSARAAGRFYHWDREPAYLERVAATIDRRCRDERLDVLFAPSSLPLARVRATIPKAFATDQVFPTLLEGYVRSPARRYVRLGLEQERAALVGANLVSFPSAWAVDQAVTRCGAARERVLLIQWGANLAAEPSEEEVAGFLERRRRDRPCNLVFIGREWRRKGGDVVVATFRELERRGMPCRLAIVGTQPPEPVPASSIVVPFLDKRRPDHARRFFTLLAEAHFLFVPSRAEAYGQVFCEAAAFGLPALSNRVGGIPSIVVDGETGFLLTPGSPPVAYADTIEGALADRERYASIGSRARARYRAVLNWQAFGERLTAALAALV
jgi:glycosyltransferase involved in cell wall biosynthesis